MNTISISRRMCRTCRTWHWYKSNSLGTYSLVRFEAEAWILSKFPIVLQTHTRTHTIKSTMIATYEACVCVCVCWGNDGRNFEYVSCTFEEEHLNSICIAISSCSCTPPFSQREMPINGSSSSSKSSSESVTVWEFQWKAQNTIWWSSRLNSILQ